MNNLVSAEDTNAAGADLIFLDAVADDILCTQEDDEEVERVQKIAQEMSIPITSSQWLVKVENGAYAYTKGSLRDLRGYIFQTLWVHEATVRSRNLEEERNDLRVLLFGYQMFRCLINALESNNEHLHRVALT